MLVDLAHFLFHRSHLIFNIPQSFILPTEKFRQLGLYLLVLPLDLLIAPFYGQLHLAHGIQNLVATICRRDRPPLGHWGDHHLLSLPLKVLLRVSWGVHIMLELLPANFKAFG